MYYLFARMVFLSTIPGAHSSQVRRAESPDVFQSNSATVSVLVLFPLRRFLFSSQSDRSSPSDSNMFVYERPDFPILAPAREKQSGIQSVSLVRGNGTPNK
jgi:hypothetical protein